jgi:hypothetical protein
MARVEIPAPGDLIMDSAGNVRVGVAVTLALAGTGTAATHYSALTAGTSTTGGLVTGSDGTIVDGSGTRRYVDSGVALDLTILSRTKRLEPLSALVESGVGFIVSTTLGDGITDATTGIQAQLDAANTAGGGTVVVPAGTYLISATLIIHSRTHLRLDPKATIKRNAAIQFMLTSPQDTAVGGYGAATDMTVSGGTWDANSSGFASNVDAIMFGHSTNVTVRDCTIKNVYGWHCLEFNSSKNCKALNLILDGQTSAPGKEMLQIDVAESASLLVMPPYDGTTCQDVLVQGCRFLNGVRGVGGHTASSAGSAYTGMRIVDCYFDTLSEQAVTPYDWADFTISGCVVKNTTGGVLMEVSMALARGIIENNVFDLTGTDTVNGRGISRPSTTTAFALSNLVIRGNVIRGAYYGIATERIEQAVIQGNIIENCKRSGIWLYQFSKEATVNGNVSKGNNTDATAGQYDFLIGKSSGAVSDTINHAVSGNRFGTVGIDFTDKVVLTGNRWTTYTDNARGGTITQANNVAGA